MTDNAPLIITYNPDEAGQRPYLKNAGQYGPGMPYPADITIGRVSLVDKTRENLPQWMKDEPLDMVEMGLEFLTDHGKVFVNHNLRVGRELNEFLLAIGFNPPTSESVGESGRTERTASFDLSTLVGTKLGCVEVDAPRQSNGKWYTGRVKRVVGA